MAIGHGSLWQNPHFNCDKLLIRNTLQRTNLESIFCKQRPESAELRPLSIMHSALYNKTIFIKTLRLKGEKFPKIELNSNSAKEL
jgi:hypothetical protein